VEKRRANIPQRESVAPRAETFRFVPVAGNFSHRYINFSAK